MSQHGFSHSCFPSVSCFSWWSNKAMAPTGRHGDFQGQIGNPCEAAEKEIFNLLCGCWPSLSVSFASSVVVTSCYDPVAENIFPLFKKYILKCILLNEVHTRGSWEPCFGPGQINQSTNYRMSKFEMKMHQWFSCNKFILVPASSPLMEKKY